ncbi:MAG: phospholipase [Clostridiales bacterium]|nr:phospholipase [Clostridiales bacterium]
MGDVILKRTIGSIIFLVVVISCYFIQKAFNVDEQKAAESESLTSLAPSIAETIEPADTFVEKKGVFTYNNQKIQYLLIFPAKYTQTADKWPMILFLHGSSLRGQNLDLVKEYGPTWFAEQRNDFPFVVLAPQCAENDNWDNKADVLVALIDDVLKKYRINEDKVYLTGTSMGGRGTWTVAREHPEYFAAIAPLAAARPKVPNTWNQLMLSMPIWAFHGEKDSVAPLKDDEAIIDSLRSQGGIPRFTILPNKGHEIAGVYKNQELYDWFLMNTRTRNR